MPKKGGAWTFCRFRGRLDKKERGVFLRKQSGGGGDTPMHTMNSTVSHNLTLETLLELYEQINLNKLTFLVTIYY